jgi:hypothetical protein
MVVETKMTRKHDWKNDVMIDSSSTRVGYLYASAWFPPSKKGWRLEYPFYTRTTREYRVFHSGEWYGPSKGINVRFFFSYLLQKSNEQSLKFLEKSF